MVTRWSPDTCDCIIEYNDDGTLSKIVKACDAHQGGTEADTFEAVLEENPRKNKSFKEILDNAPPALFDVDADTGTRVFKRGINVDFQWEGDAPNRNLKLKVQGISLTANQLNAIQNKINAKFGDGKVKLEQG